jgi:hypothetical protein
MGLMVRKPLAHRLTGFGLLFVDIAGGRFLWQRKAQQSLRKPQRQ